MNKTDKTYLMASEVADMLGGNWSRTMVHTYLSRGKFPEPAEYINRSPVWTPEQIERYKKERG